MSISPSDAQDVPSADDVRDDRPPRWWSRLAVPRLVSRWAGRVSGLPLFYRLFGALMLVGLIPAAPIFFLSFKYSEQAASLRAEKALTQQLTILAANFEQEYRTASQRSLKQVASSDALVSLLSGPREERLVSARSLEALFFNIAKEHASYSGVYFIDAEGRQIAAVVDQQRRGNLGESVSWMGRADTSGGNPTHDAGERLFKRISTTPALLSAGNMEWFMPPRDIQFEGPFVDERNRPSLLVGLPTLDVDSGAFSGAAIIRLNLESFIEVLKAVRLFDESLAWLFAADGSVLLGPRGSASTLDPGPLLSPESVAEPEVVRTPTGLVAYRDLAVSGEARLMRLAYAVPYALIAKDFAATRNVFLLAMLLSVIAAFGVTFAVSRTISRPIVRLADAARTLSRGDLSSRVDLPAAGEVKVLVDSFNTMAANLERSVRELGYQSTVIDKAPFGILLTDPRAPDNPVRYFNEAFARLMGYPASEVLGRNPRFIFSEDADPRAVEAVERALTEHRATETELRNRSHDGGVHLMRWLVFPCYSGAGELLSDVVFLNDLTDIRATEAERERLAAELQESNKLQFLSLTIAGMSHDLNTPIGVGVTAASHMRRTVDRLLASVENDPGDLEAIRSLSGKIRESSEIIGRNLEKAGQLVQGFKRTSANATRNEWVTVNLASLLESVLVTVSPLLHRAQCKVTLECPPNLKLYTEPGSVSQAITNLLVNATLHAFEGRDDRRIRLAVEEDGSEVRLTVADNGNGMSEEARVKAFTPFFTTKRASGGSGLGLFSCRRVVEEVLGGKITLQTGRDEGTAFVITLPRRSAAGAAISE